MRTACIVLCVCAAAGVAAALAGEKPAPAPEAEKPKQAKEFPPFEPTSAFEVRQIEGFRVLVHKRLLGEKKDLGDRTLAVLRNHLEFVNRVIPPPALERLQKIPTWVEINPRVACMCYHPSRGWLTQNGFNPEKAGSVELGGPEKFLSWTKHQFAMILHELAHGYHHQVLGYGHPEVKALYRKAMDAKLLDEVLYFAGDRKRHYAANNDQEYFAEMTEAYFSTNDFYPFVRAELKEHDPAMHDLVRRLWENPPSEPAK